MPVVLLVVFASLCCSRWLLVVAMLCMLLGETMSSVATLSPAVLSGKDAGVVLLSGRVEL